MSQSNQLPEQIREITEQNISRRLRVTRWTQRLLVGAGIVGGAIVGSHNTESEAVGAVVDASLLAGIVVGGTERYMAVRSCRRQVSDYGQIVGAHSKHQRYRSTDISVNESGQAMVSQEYDFKADDSPTRHGALFGWATSGVTFATGYTGGYLTSAALNHQLLVSSAETAVTTLGATMIGVTAMIHVLCNETGGLQKTFTQQLNNIDSSIAFRPGNPSA